MEQLSNKIHNKPTRPIKVLQFGEGNFLRAFVDWIIQNMNDKGVYNGDVVIAQPTPNGRVENLLSQDGLYTLYLQGIQNSKTVSDRKIIDVMADGVCPYDDYKKYLDYAKCDTLEVVVSNTTEAGIALDKTDTDFSQCPKSFPGKLLAFLYERYKHYKGDINKGLCIIPCELIDNNGQELKKVMLELANIAKMDKDFISWLEKANTFTDTLVDRIVPGYPKQEIDKIQQECNYIDSSVVKGEIFHLWVLKKNERIQKVFPADKAGLNVIFADDITPYKQRKVKILNGSHTALVPIAYLSGLDTVGDSVNDKAVGKFLIDFIYQEINKTIDLPEKELNDFADSVIERFKNPFIRHELMSIALNSTTKFKTRLLPTLKDYLQKTKELPKHLMFAFAAFILFHKGDRNGQKINLQDSKENLEIWNRIWSNDSNNIEKIVNDVASNIEFWEEDLTKLHKDLVNVTSGYLNKMIKVGVKKAVEEF